MATQNRILRRPEVSRLTGLSYSTIDRYEHAGSFPARVRLGQNAIGWHASEVEDWVRQRVRVGAWSGKAADASGR